MLHKILDKDGSGKKRGKPKKRLDHNIIGVLVTPDAEHDAVEDKHQNQKDQRVGGKHVRFQSHQALLIAAIYLHQPEESTAIFQIA